MSSMSSTVKPNRYIIIVRIPVAEIRIPEKNRSLHEQLSSEQQVDYHTWRPFPSSARLCLLSRAVYNALMDIDYRMCVWT